MTTQQQSIIDALTTEFARINESNTTKKGFKLINADALQEHTKANRLFAELSEQDLATWKRAAYAEMERIIELLEQDLPSHVMVERFNTHIGKYDDSAIQLRHQSVSPKTHHENVVSIHVVVSKHRKSNDYGSNLDFGKGLQYTTSQTGWNTPFDTIEEAVNHKYFQDALRQRVIR